ncbi:MAG TPA: acetyl-CoA carboxylase carboxyltransferase subunit alpha [Ktedonobacterales bacterium]|nr:acetyl-CoA carboxylase carboxyltransferase subunit alpha [Ktedonobacterales bacterium]
MSYDLDFERPLLDMDKRIQALLKKGEAKLKPDERIQLRELQTQIERRTREIYGSLAASQRVQVARHRQRPYAADYIKLMCDDFFELRGDRRFADDRAIIGGLASIEGRSVVLIGSQKGRETKEKLERNFGLTHAEGYRKAQRLMRHAERFHLPVVTLIDTSGAAPDLEAEQRGIAQAIAESLFVMAELRSPIVSVVTGEGGSGGALGIGVADRILMFENSIYTVASPEAAASILFRDNGQWAAAANAMKICAQDLMALGLIEEIIAEPLGGAHRDPATAAASLKEAVLRHVGELEELSADCLVERRYERYRKIGAYATEVQAIGALS